MLRKHLLQQWMLAVEYELRDEAAWSLRSVFRRCKFSFVNNEWKTREAGAAERILSAPVLPAANNKLASYG